jgi:hypothetical protein
MGVPWFDGVPEGGLVGRSDTVRPVFFLCGANM